MNEIENQKKPNLDGLSSKVRQPLFFDLPLANFVRRYKKSSTAYYKQKITDCFISKGKTSLYFNQEDLLKARKGERIFPSRLAVDSLTINIATPLISQRYVFFRGKEDLLAQRIKKKYYDLAGYLNDLIHGSVEGVTLVRAWNVSIVSSVIFGMFLMTMIYRYLGQGVHAGTSGVGLATKNQTRTELSLKSDQDVLDEEEADYGGDSEYTAQLIEDYNNKIKEGRESDSMEKEIREMVKGYPIEKMAPYIARKDRLVAAFLIGIAKKESDWGKHVPICDGKDSFNLWGFRAKSEKMGTGGHTCFKSPEAAVDAVAKRLEFLISKEKIDTPDKMVVVWKCGYDCSWDSKAAVNKWISDVNMYFKKFNKKVK